MFTIPVEERDGNLWCGDVQVSGSSAVREVADPERPFHYRIVAWRLTKDTLDALDLSRHAHLIRCSQCGQQFIGHASRRLCSQPACRAATRRAAVAKYDAKARTRPRVGAKQPDIGRDCEVCDKPMDFARRSRRYCSNRCRQAAHRQRVTLTG
jgi:hypothetical protein